MAFVIVTKRCFLTCESVTSVIVEEEKPKPLVQGVKKKSKKVANALKKRVSKKVEEEPDGKWTITICYIPTVPPPNASQSYSSSGSEFSIGIQLYSKREAFLLYAEIIKEVQEQYPDNTYLDKLMETVLSGKEFEETDAD